MFYEDYSKNNKAGGMWHHQHPDWKIKTNLKCCTIKLYFLSSKGRIYKCTKSTLNIIKHLVKTDNVAYLHFHCTAAAGHKTSLTLCWYKNAADVQNYVSEVSNKYQFKQYTCLCSAALFNLFIYLLNSSLCKHATGESRCSSASYVKRDAFLKLAQLISENNKRKGKCPARAVNVSQLKLMHLCYLHADINLSALKNKLAKIISLCSGPPILDSDWSVASIFDKL